MQTSEHRPLRPRLEMICTESFTDVGHCVIGGANSQEV